ncbi:MAG: hypothetical protein QGH15_07905 [Kiritimatiellia bacterium]|nr:hypothetical protein [Kiritimatiellia bacterium]
MSKRTKHLVEYFAVRAMGGFVNLLPYRLAAFIGWVLARASFCVIGKRKAKARKRVKEVFGADIPESEVSRIVWKSWLNVVLTATELMRISRVTLSMAKKVSQCGDAMDRLTTHRDTGVGAILALPHMGSWEMAAATARTHGVPLFTIAAPQKNTLVDQYINDTRRKAGTPVIMRGDGTIRQVIRMLRKGNVLAILPDLRRRVAAVKVRFLGAEANVANGMAFFAKMGKVPIFPCYITRKGLTRHALHVLDPVYPEPELQRDADIQRMTSEVFSIFDKAIRENPDQWFWYNKRWVLDPVEETDPPA